MDFDGINFFGQDWARIKTYLEAQKDIAIQVLCSDITPEESNKQRGKIMFITQMLYRAERIIDQASKNTGR